MSLVKHEPLAHHFEDLGQQHEAASLGMWVFLGTELMVFGGLFTGYTVYRSLYPDAFAAASRHLNVWFGAVNTVVLLTSSLTMALGVHAAQTGRRQALVGCLLLTAALGTAFLVIKGFEYYGDYQDNLIPRLAFKEEEWQAPEHAPRGFWPGTWPTSAEQERALFPRRVQMFYVFYYVMTLLHALHLIIGIGIILVLAALAWRGRFTPDYYSPVDVGGLYWHFVDVIWIFLLPLLYLVGSRH
jgi:cytochrome c oxidase subunit 3